MTDLCDRLLQAKIAELERERDELLAAAEARIQEPGSWICWLIERNSMFGVEWFAGECGWVKEAINAIKFPDKETAIWVHTKFYWLRENPSFPYILQGGGDWEYTHTITEHMFISTTNNDAPLNPAILEIGVRTHE